MAPAGGGMTPTQPSSIGTRIERPVVEEYHTMFEIVASTAFILYMHG